MTNICKVVVQDSAQFIKIGIFDEWLDIHFIKLGVPDTWGFIVKHREREDVITGEIGTELQLNFRMDTITGNRLSIQVSHEYHNGGVYTIKVKEA